MRRLIAALTLAAALAGCNEITGPSIEGPNGYTLVWTASNQAGISPAWSRLDNSVYYYVVIDERGEFVLRTLSFARLDPFTCAEFSRVFPAQARRLGW